MLQEYTVKDIAAAIAHGGDHRKVLRRLKHWSKEGPLSNWLTLTTDTGTGHYRRYQPEAIYWAALISELTQYGMTAEMADQSLLLLQTGLPEIGEDRGEDFWQSAVNGRRDVIAVFCADFDQQIAKVGVYLDPETTTIPDSYTSALAINLTKLFARIRR